MICDEFSADFDQQVVFVQDRLFNDQRYALSWDKIIKLGWQPQRRLPEDLPSIVAWYKANAVSIMNSMELVHEQL